VQPKLLVLDDVRAAIERHVGGLALSWPVLVLDWRRDDASTELDTQLRRGHGVLVLSPDERGELEALEAGATEAMRWPAEPAHLLARVRRTARLARGPWLESIAQLVDESLELADTEACLLDVNPAFERVTGYPRAEVLGKTTAALFRVETVDPTYYRQIGEGLAARGIWHGQLTARRHDRSISFMQATVAVVHDATGRVVGHLGIKRDASRDDLASSALAGAEARTRALMDRAAEAVLLHTPDGRIVDANRSACRMLNVDRSELLGQTVDAFEPSVAVEGLLEMWHSLGDSPVSRETTWRRYDGSSFPVELSVGRVDLVGNPFAFVIARDITDRRKAEDALRTLNARLELLNERLEDEVAARTRELREALARLAAFVDSVADGLVAVSQDRTVVRANPAALQMFDAIGGVEGRPVEELHPGLADLVEDCLRFGTQRAIDLPLGERRAGSAHANPIVVDDGGGKTIVGCVVLVRDVTREREVDRMKTDFIATVSHELRTPLTSVLGFAKLARAKLDLLLPLVPADDKRLSRAAEQVAGNLEIISSEGQRLASLIGDVLDISKMEAGRVDWRADAIRPSDLVDRAITATSGLFADSSVRCLRAVDDDLPVVVGDADRLLQVVINLISNAVKFTEAGSITVGARLTSDGIEVSVTDTGAGIPASDHALIFERFRQSSSDTLTDKPKGTGLGLAISKHICEHHGGRIWVESEVGHGSRFAFVLPVRRSPATLAPPSDQALRRLLERIAEVFPTSSRGTGADILVVDDDDGTRELLRQVLTDAGYQVRWARDGIAAITEVRRRRPDLLVLDVLMPGLSGFDVAALVRADPETHQVPILVLSVLTDPERGLRLGVDRYLTKPLVAGDLLSAIETLLRRAKVPRRVLIVDPTPEHVEAVRSVLESDRYDVVGTCGVEDAIARARELRPDLVVVGAPVVGLVEAIRDDVALQHIAVVALVES